MRAKDLVPEREVEPKVHRRTVVVKSVVRRPDHPAAQPVMGEPAWEVVEIEVVHDCPHSHGTEHSQQGDQVQGNQHHNHHQKQGLHQGFWRIKRKGCPGCGPDGAVMPPVKQGIQNWMME